MQDPLSHSPYRAGRGRPSAEPAVEGIFLLELTWFLTPFPQNSFGWEYKPRLPSHGPKRSWHSRPKRVNAGNENTPNMHPRRPNVNTSMVELKMAIYAKISPQVVKPRDTKLGRQKKPARPVEVMQDPLSRNLAGRTVGLTWRRGPRKFLKVVSHNQKLVCKSLGSEAICCRWYTKEYRSTTTKNAITRPKVFTKMSKGRERHETAGAVVHGAGPGRDLAEPTWPRCPPVDRNVGLVVKASTSWTANPGSNSAFSVGMFTVRVIPVT